jgi:hypothetical protein
MMQALLFLLPREFWVLLLMAAGIMMMIGFRKAALGIVGSVVLLALLSPFIDSLIDALPTWILIILMIFFAMSLLRFVFGRGVADHLISHLLYDVILMPFRFIGWLFRGPTRRY